MHQGLDLLVWEKFEKKRSEENIGWGFKNMETDCAKSAHRAMRSSNPSMPYAKPVSHIVNPQRRHVRTKLCGHFELSIMIATHTIPVGVAMVVEHEALAVLRVASVRKRLIVFDDSLLILKTYRLGCCLTFCQGGNPHVVALGLAVGCPTSAKLYQQNVYASKVYVSKSILQQK